MLLIPTHRKAARSRFYEQAGPTIADRFEAEMRVGLARIQLNPRRYPFYRGSAFFRRFQLPNFPYVIVDRELPTRFVSPCSSMRNKTLPLV